MQHPTRIDELVTAYLAVHPDYQYPPSGDRHPAVLAIGTQVKSWLMDRLGGPLPFWTAMLDSARVWFPPGHDSRELLIFQAMFEADANTFWEGRPEFVGLNRRYSQWRLRQRQAGETVVARRDRGPLYGAAGTVTVTQDLFMRDFDHYMNIAEKRPVKIQGTDRSGIVLLSIEEYGRLVCRDQEATANEALLRDTDQEHK